MAWSQHEIVADFVRPTLMWLEAKGKGATLNSLVKKFSLNGNLRCLTESTEGCLSRWVDGFVVGGGRSRVVSIKKVAPAGGAWPELKPS